MKVASVLVLAATAFATVSATGSATCTYGTPAPTTPAPTTTEPTTPEPTTPEPTTPVPTTSDPTTPEPTSTEPTTPEPTTPAPTTPEPTTPEPTTLEPATPEPTTPGPTTSEPATPEPTTEAPATPVDCVIYPLNEDPGEWSSCSLEDDKFYKTRVLGIKTPAANGGMCPGPTDPSRALKLECEPVNCVVNTKEQDVGAYGGCSDNGQGAWYQYRVLGVFSSAENGGTCPTTEDPVRQDSRKCEPVDCLIKSKDEDIGPYGECAQTATGGYVQTRVLGIKQSAQYGGACPDEQSALRIDSLQCEAVNCVVNTKSEDQGAYGACGDNGEGNYYQHRVLGIKTPATNGGTCPDERDILRQDSLYCEKVNCVVNTKDEETAAYGACSKDASSDVYYKSRLLGIKTLATNGGSCPGSTDASRIDSVKCDPIACVVNTKDEDKGAYGDCLQTANGYYKSRVLGIKQVEQYGGSCPGPDDAVRQDSAECPPVACVVKSVAEDDGAYSTCFQDPPTGKYIKTKVLGIKEEARYGGTCLTESERTVSAPCAAVDCVVNTPEEEQGAFTACIDDGTDVWSMTRVLRVKEEAKYGGLCPTEAERTQSVVCAPVACTVNEPSEDDGAFGDCQDSGNGWFKSRVLGIKEPEQNGGSCPAPTDRMDVVVCAAVNCVIKTKQEETGAYGDCVKTESGEYFKSRVLSVKEPAQNGGSCPSDTDASRQDRVQCEAVACVVNTKEEDTGAYGDCKDNGSGGWFQTRVLGIKTQALYGGSCPDDKDPLRQDALLCPKVSCVVKTEAEDLDPFTACADNGQGQWFKTKVLGIATPALHGGSCPTAEERTISKLCTPVPCVVNTESEDTGGFGACANDGTGDWYKSKVLGIKTPAQYGGSCKTEAQRTVKLPCPKVNCVVNTVAEETSPYSACSPGTDGKYYRTRTLGIKTSPLNGGTACPAAGDRVDKLLCPAVACVVNTPAEDTGAFAACALNTVDNKWYKAKVLAIKTEAQYGGSCPSPTARTYKVVCPDDGFCHPWDPNYATCIPKLAQCGIKRPSWYNSGSTIKSYAGIAQWQCCDNCGKTAGCAGYVFFNNTDATRTACDLKWADPSGWSLNSNSFNSLVVSPLSASCSYKDDSRFTSGTRIGTRTMAADLDECCARCKSTVGCKAFNMNDNNMCELRTSSASSSADSSSRMGAVI